MYLAVFLLSLSVVILVGTLVIKEQQVKAMQSNLDYEIETNRHLQAVVDFYRIENFTAVRAPRVDEEINSILDKLASALDMQKQLELAIELGNDPNFRVN